MKISNAASFGLYTLMVSLIFSENQILEFNLFTVLVWSWSHELSTSEFPDHQCLLRNLERHSTVNFEPDLSSSWEMILLLIAVLKRLVVVNPMWCGRKVKDGRHWELVTLAASFGLDCIAWLPEWLKESMAVGQPLPPKWKWHFQQKGERFVGVAKTHS